MATTLLSSRSYAFSLDTSCHLAAVLCFTVEPALSDLLTKPRPTTDSATLAPGTFLAAQKRAH